MIKHSTLIVDHPTGWLMANLLFAAGRASLRPPQSPPVEGGNRSAERGDWLERYQWRKRTPPPDRKTDEDVHRFDIGWSEVDRSTIRTIELVPIKDYHERRMNPVRCPVDRSAASRFRYRA
jgi:hypothetical protein